MTLFSLQSLPSQYDSFYIGVQKESTTAAVIFESLIAPPLCYIKEVEILRSKIGTYIINDEEFTMKSHIIRRRPFITGQSYPLPSF